MDTTSTTTDTDPTAETSPTSARALSRRAALGVGIASLVALLVLAVAWVAWPESEPRADLVATPTVPPPPSTTTTSTTTTAPPSAPPATAPAPAPAPAPAVRPSSLVIPSLGVDADVIPVGLQPDGQMEIPPAAQVGWYELGPEPGAGGSAVLAAHIDYAGERGAFFALPSLAVGAEITVVGPDGTPRRFVVTQREQVGKAEVDLSRYFTNQGDPRLTLITCGGAFNSSVRHYEDNIIVTAVPV